MQQSELNISISAESYDEKTAENYRNCYVVEKNIVFKLSRISIPNFDTTKFQVPIFHAFREISHQRELWLCWFIVLNDSASPN